MISTVGIILSLEGTNMLGIQVRPSLHTTINYPTVCMTYIYVRRTVDGSAWWGTASSRAPPCSVPAAWNRADRRRRTPTTDGGSGVGTRTTNGCGTWQGWTALIHRRSRRVGATTTKRRRSRGGTATGPDTRPGCWRTSGSRCSWTTPGTGSRAARTGLRGVRRATVAPCNGQLPFASTPERLFTAY